MALYLHSLICIHYVHTDNIAFLLLCVTHSKYFLTLHYLSVGLLEEQCICPRECILECSFWISWIERTFSKELVEVAHTIYCSICPSMTIEHCIVTGGAPILWQSSIVHNHSIFKTLLSSNIKIYLYVNIILLHDGLWTMQEKEDKD